MKKILLLTVAMLSATTAYSMCSLPQGAEGTEDNRCHCQFPVFDGKELKCGDDYCEKVGKNVWMMAVVVQRQIKAKQNAVINIIMEWLKMGLAVLLLRQKVVKLKQMK